KDSDEVQSLPAELAAILAATATPEGPAFASVRNFYRREHSSEYKRLFADMEKWKGEQGALEKAIPTTMIAREMDKRRETHILLRGEYDKVGDGVTPGVPSILPPFPKDAPTNRLGLARWLLSPLHPLTARVTPY